MNFDKLFRSTYEAVVTEGDPGLPVSELWEYLKRTFPDISFDTKTLEYLWTFIRNLNGLEIQTPDSESSFSNAILIASPEIQRSILLSNHSSQTLNEIQFTIIKLLSKRKEKGSSQVQLSQTLNIEPKTLFYHLKHLSQHDLIVKSPYQILDSKCLSNVWFIKRFYDENQQEIIYKEYLQVNGFSGDLAKERVMMILCEAKNHTVRSDDLMRLMNIDIHIAHNPKRKTFNSMIRRLIELGHVERVCLVEDETDESKKDNNGIRMIKPLSSKKENSVVKEKIELVGECGLVAELSLSSQVERLVRMSGKKGATGTTLQYSLKINDRKMLDRLMVKIVTDNKEFYRVGEYLGKEKRYRYFSNQKHVSVQLIQTTLQTPINTPISTPLQTPINTPISTPEGVMQDTVLETLDPEPLSPRVKRKRSQPKTLIVEEISEEMQDFIEPVVKTKKNSTGKKSSIFNLETLTSSQRKQILLDIITRRQFIERGQELLDLMNKEVNAEQPIAHIIDKSTILRWAESLKAQVLFNMRNKLNGNMVKKTIFCIHTLNSDSPEIQEFIQSLNEKKYIVAPKKEGLVNKTVLNDNADDLEELVERLNKKDPSIVYCIPEEVEISPKDTDLTITRNSSSVSKSSYFLSPKFLRARLFYQFLISTMLSEEGVGFRNHGIISVGMIFKNLTFGLFIRFVRIPKSYPEFEEFIKEYDFENVKISELSPVIGSIVNKYLPSLKLALVKLFDIIEALHMIKGEEKTNDRFRSNYTLLKQVPIYDYRRSSRPFITYLHINSLEDAKKVWRTIEIMSVQNFEFNDDEMIQDDSSPLSFITEKKSWRFHSAIKHINQSQKDILEAYIDFDSNTFITPGSEILREICLATGLHIIDIQDYYNYSESCFVDRMNFEGNFILSVSNTDHPTMLRTDKYSQLAKKVQRNHGRSKETPVVMDMSAFKKREAANIRKRTVWSSKEEDLLMHAYVIASSSKNNKVWVSISELFNEKDRHNCRNRTLKLIKNRQGALKVIENKYALLDKSFPGFCDETSTGIKHLCDLLMDQTQFEFGTIDEIHQRFTVNHDSNSYLPLDEEYRLQSSTRTGIMFLQSRPFVTSYSTEQQDVNDSEIECICAFIKIILMTPDSCYNPQKASQILDRYNPDKIKQSIQILQKSGVIIHRRNGFKNRRVPGLEHQFSERFLNSIVPSPLISQALKFGELLKGNFEGFTFFPDSVCGYVLIVLSKWSCGSIQCFSSCDVFDPFAFDLKFLPCLSENQIVNIPQKRKGISDTENEPLNNSDERLNDTQPSFTDDMLSITLLEIIKSFGDDGITLDQIIRKKISNDKQVMNTLRQLKQCQSIYLVGSHTPTFITTPTNKWFINKNPSKSSNNNEYLSQRIWLDMTGQINPLAYQSIYDSVFSILLSRPGISFTSLVRETSLFLSAVELYDLIDEFIQCKSVYFNVLDVYAISTDFFFGTSEELCLVGDRVFFYCYNEWWNRVDLNESK